jgi:phosphatidylglycerol:prolipoprotein diacylglycerol transferase
MFLTIAFPVFDPVAVVHRADRDPLVRAGLYRRHRAGLVLRAQAGPQRDALWERRSRRRSPCSTFDDFILWVTLGIIVGGRTGYVLFYNLP